MDESYNGWANRETWAFNLHWQNDQGFYLWVLESASEVIEHATYPPVSDTYLGERIVSIVRSQMLQSPSSTR